MRGVDADREARYRAWPSALSLQRGEGPLPSLRPPEEAWVDAVPCATPPLCFWSSSRGRPPVTRLLAGRSRGGLKGAPRLPPCAASAAPSPPPPALGLRWAGPGPGLPGAGPGLRALSPSNRRQGARHWLGPEASRPPANGVAPCHKRGNRRGSPERVWLRRGQCASAPPRGRLCPAAAAAAAVAEPPRRGAALGAGSGARRNPSAVGRAGLETLPRARLEPGCVRTEPPQAWLQVGFGRGRG